MLTNYSWYKFILSFIFEFEYANLGSYISSSFFDSSYSNVYCISILSSGIFLMIYGIMVSKSLKDLVDYLNNTLDIDLLSSPFIPWYYFYRNSSIRSRSQLPRCITTWTKFCNFFSLRYCFYMLLQSLLRNWTKDFVKGRLKCRYRSCWIVYYFESNFFYGDGRNFYLERFFIREFLREN